MRSTHALPGLTVTTAEFDEADVWLRFGDFALAGDPPREKSEEPVYVSSLRTEAGEPALRIWKIPGNGLLRMDYADGTQFWLDANSGEIWARWTETSSFEDAVSYLLGPVFGYLLRLKGITCLHASAIACGGKAVAFVGAPGAGKSTTAAAMALRGHPLISDDIVALAESDGEFYALPAYPYLSLWPDSVATLYGGAANGKTFSENFPKRMLPLAEHNLRLAPQPVALHSVFLLGPRRSGRDAPVVEEVERREALMALVGNTYANLLLDEQMRKGEFKLLGRLVARVTVRRLRAAESASGIGPLCELIEGQVTARPAAISQEPAHP